MLPVGIIAGATIGAGVLLTFFFIALVFFLYRRRKGSEYGPRARPGPRGQARGAPRVGLQRLAERAQAALPCPGRKDVTLRKLDIKVETVNREPLTMHSDREDDTASVSTATRVMKAIYSVRVLSARTGDTCPSSTKHLLSVCLPWFCYTQAHAHTCSRMYTQAHRCSCPYMHACTHTSSPG